MSMLKAKQIKLNAAGDLLIGGVNGNGVTLSAGTTGQFLKVTGAGTLQYLEIAQSDVTGLPAALTAITDAATTLTGRVTAVEGVNTTQDGLLAGLRTDVTAAQGAITTLQTNAGVDEGRIAAIITGLGFDSTTGELVPFTGTYVSNASVEGAIIALDTALASLASTAASDSFTGTGVGIRQLVSTTKETAINEISNKAVHTKVDAVNTPAVGNDSTQGYAVGDIWVNGNNAYVALDVSVGAAVWTRVDQNANAALFTYKGTANASQASEALAAMETGVESGDTYKITVAGNFSGALSYNVNVGDFIVWTGSAWDKIDSTDPVVSGTAGTIAVSGSDDAGFVVTIDPTYVGQASITTLGTVTTGVWNGTLIDIAHGGTGLAAVGTAGKVLVSTGTGLAYAYPSVLTDGAGAGVLDASTGKLIAATSTVAGDVAKTVTTKDYVDAAISAAGSAGARSQVEEDFTATTTVNFSFTLTSAPIGAVAIFFNGLKLAKTNYTVVGSVVTLVDSALGYSAEAGDVIAASYIANV